MSDLAALQLPIWCFVAIASLSATIGAMLASQFDGVRVPPNTCLGATATPAILALLLVPGPVPLGFALWSMVLILGLSGLAVIDAVSRTVPDILTVPLIPLGLLHAEMNGAPGLVFALAALGVIGIAIAAHMALRRQATWLGAGDVLLLAGAVAWFGPAVLPDILFLTGLLLLIRLGLGELIDLRPATCVPVARRADRAMPLAPALGAAQLLVWLGGPVF
ncbi:A24 family peptidase [Defluviimonas sp. SAOS-178_SWC]|uniref:A24 family peptidase n=1 Tax=Defluviimonas sp. SAOS-178_SWC TaxID=3121287 RepID=UPI003221E411